MVLVQFRVTVPDVDRFKRTYEKFRPLAVEDGERNGALYVSESDPNEVTMLGEWESHDQMHASSEKRGDEFQAEAGTEGLEWETRIWQKLA